jgi:hypothetical protein
MDLKAGYTHDSGTMTCTENNPPPPPPPSSSPSSSPTPSLTPVPEVTEVLMLIDKYLYSRPLDYIIILTKNDMIYNGPEVELSTAFAIQIEHTNPDILNQTNY